MHLVGGGGVGDMGHRKFPLPCSTGHQALRELAAVQKGRMGTLMFVEAIGSSIKSLSTLTFLSNVRCSIKVATEAAAAAAAAAVVAAPYAATAVASEAATVAVFSDHDDRSCGRKDIANGNGK